MTSTSLRQAVYAAAVAGAASSGCFGDASGPATMRGTLALAPVFPSAAAPLVAVADLELVIRTGPDAIVFDTTIALEAGADSVDLTVTFDAPESNGPLELVLGLRNAQGAVVFIGGPMDVTPTPVGTTPPPTTVPLLYVGVGANAASVKIDEPETFVPFETEYVLTAEALDNSGAPIAGTPIGWKTLDTALVTLPDQASGRIVSRSRRGSARIVAALLTGIEDTASIVIQPNPSGLVMTGDGQRGIVGSTVTTPIQATIIGPDDLPIAGVWVRFTASDGGAVSADSVLTDAEGIASVIWMLGPTAGVQTLSAVTPTTPTVTGNVTATAVAVRAVVRWVNPVDGMWSNPLNWSDGIAPGSGDSVAIDVDGTYTVTADVPAMVRSMTFGATSGQQQLQISGQSFTASGAVEVASGTLLLSNGRLEAPAGLTVLADATLDMTHGTVDAPLDLQGTLIARAGFHAVTGAAITAASSSLQVRGAGSATSLDFDAGLTMNGTFELTNDVPSIPATVQISGGPFTIGNTGQVVSAAGQFGARIIRATWNNQGTITTAAPLLLASNGANTNAGTLDIAEGVLNLDLGGTGSITNTGNITIGTAAGLAVSNGILAHEAGAIGGTGFVNLANVTFSMIPDLTVGPLQALFTNTAISGSGTLFINPDNGVSLVDATVGTDIDAQGTLNFQGGVVLNGVVTLAPSSTFAVLGVPGGTTVTVAQPLVMNGPAILLSGADDVTLDVSAGGMTIPSGSSLSVPIATGGTRTIIGDLTLQGAISIDHPLILEGGAFAVSPSGGLNGTSALDLSAATSVTIDGGVFPGGVFPATLTIIGDFPLATGGTATFDIDGLIPGTEHDRIDVSGTASILGTINLQPSISPQPGDAFTVLTFGARGPGAVAGLTGPTDFVGSILDTVWTANSLRIEALPTLVFAGDSGGGLSSGVFRASPGGGRVIRVTPQGTTGDVYPRWAPDRSRIALNRPNQVDFTNELLLVSADGAVTATVMSDTSSRRARFNATGQRLAFECGDGFSPMQDVCAIQSDVSGSIAGLANAGNGAGKLFLTDGIAPDLQGSGAFAWDPSNTDELIVVRDSLLNGQRASQLWRIRFDGSGVTAVTDTVFATPGGDTLQIASMDWSPNGVFIAFEAANQAGNSAIYRFDVSTGAVTPLTFPTPSTFDRRPVVSPDNAEVLFARELDGWELRRVPATGGGEVTITPVFNHFIGQAGWDWSPDGSEIVLTDDIVSSGNVVVVRVLRSTTNGTYASDRIVVGRAGTLPGEVQDRQPSWRP